jgi:hypothetical protein
MDNQDACRMETILSFSLQEIDPLSHPIEVSSNFSTNWLNKASIFSNSLSAALFPESAFTKTKHQRERKILDEMSHTDSSRQLGIW